MPGYKAFTIREFAGLNEDENPDVLTDAELSVASNVWKHGEALGTRPGLERDTEYNAACTGTACITGLSYYTRNFDGDDNIIAVSSGAVFTDDSTSLAAGPTITSPGTGTANAGTNLWTFAQHRGRVYAAGGADGDSIWYWDGTAPGATSVTFNNAAGAAMDAKFIFEKWNFLFLGGMNGALVEDNPTVFRYSAINDGTVSAARWARAASARAVSG